MLLLLTHVTLISQILQANPVPLNPQLYSELAPSYTSGWSRFFLSPSARRLLQPIFLDAITASASKPSSRRCSRFDTQRERDHLNRRSPARITDCAPLLFDSLPVVTIGCSFGRARTPVCADGRHLLWPRRMAGASIEFDAAKFITLIGVCVAALFTEMACQMACRSRSPHNGCW